MIMTNDTVTPEETQIDLIARLIAAAVYRPQPDMSGDVFKAVGPLRERGARDAARAVYEEVIASAIRTAENEALERAAKVAEDFRHPNPFPTVYGAIATAILALKSTPPQADGERE